MSQAGAFVRHQGIGTWWRAIDQAEWPQDDEFKQNLKNHWDESYGDRRQELVFIGLSSEMKPDHIRAQLDACLIEDYLQKPESYQNIRDPFPQWFENTDEMAQAS